MGEGAAQQSINSRGVVGITFKRGFTRLALPYRHLERSALSLLAHAPPLHRLFQFLIDTALPTGTVFLERIEDIFVETERHLLLRVFEWGAAAFRGATV